MIFLTKDDFLDLQDFKELQNIILGDLFPWYFKDSVVHDNDGYFQFVHQFYNKCEVKSHLYGCLLPLIKKLNVNAIIRIKANLTTATENNVIFDFHKDQKFDCKTAVFYLNTNNGFTRFENGNKVQSRENRILLFTNDVVHTGSTCTDQKRRVVLNINYI
jgi:hypothetical protein